MLCTAPTVIKHCCPPAAPQCIAHQPSTLQPSHTFHSLIFTQAQTAPQAPSLKKPYLPSITPQSHPLCTPLSPFATHPCYTFTSHPQPCIPKPCPHTHALILPSSPACALSPRIPTLKCPRPKDTRSHACPPRPRAHCPFPLLLHPLY